MSFSKHHPLSRGLSRFAKLVATLTVAFGGTLAAGATLPAGALPGDPAPLSISAGTGHTCVTMTTAAVGTNKVRCWGQGDYGQLGNGTIVDSLVSVEATVPSAALIAMGGFHSCSMAVLLVSCWGSNSYGELGDGTTVAKNVPTAVVGMGGSALQVATGSYHSCAILAAGTVKCWGLNDKGQLGSNATGSSSAAPVALNLGTLGAGVTALQVTLGVAHTCVRLSDGTVRCVGDNASGQLGTGAIGNPLPPKPSPTAVVTVSGATQISAGANHTCAIVAAGAVKCWGAGSFGQLGYGAQGDNGTPVTAIGVTASSIEAGGFHTCAVITGGAVKCWGKNDVGQVGSGATVQPLPLPAPQLPGELTPVSVSLGTGLTASAIAMGESHSCALLNTQTVKCWGLNNKGQLGTKSTANSFFPVSVVVLPARPLTMAAPVAVAGDAQASVAFVAPAFNGSDVTSITVTASPGGATATVTVAAPPTPTSVLVTGLTNGVAYTFTVAATNASGAGTNSPASATVTPTAGAVIPPATTGDFAAMAPSRLMDTRPSGVTIDGAQARGGQLVAGSVTKVDVAGRATVPADASAVVLNVTVTGTKDPGFATVFPCGGRTPTASNLNYGANDTIPNAVITEIGENGQVCVFTSAATDLIVDINGFFPVDSSFVSGVPRRFVDTRPTGETIDNAQAQGGARPAGSIMKVDVAGRDVVPADASAVVLNVTVTGTKDPGFATVFPCGGRTPTASNLNYGANDTIPNAVITKIGENGQVCVFTSAATDLIVDITGYFPAGTTFVSAAPARLIDTRPAGETIDGAQQREGVRLKQSITEVQVTGRAGVPTTATAVVLNVTVTGTKDPGFATVFPCGGGTPTASNLNYGANDTIPNAVITKIGLGGKVCVYTESATDLIVDINGYFP